MGVKGKLVSEISIKSEQDVFHLLSFPTPIPNICPNKVQSVELLSGHWGNLGTIFSWHYTQGGEKKVNTVIIDALDEKKKSITYKSIQGNLLESCNAFQVTVDVRSNGDEHVLTWTFEYEKKSASVPDPHPLMDFLLDFSRDLETNSQSQLIPN